MRDINHKLQSVYTITDKIIRTYVLQIQNNNWIRNRISFNNVSTNTIVL